MSEPAPRSERSTVRRIGHRGRYDAETIHAILDEGLWCVVAIAVDRQPYAVPMAYGRIGDHVYLHGARASRLMQQLARGTEACVTVTLLDGLVLARSLFHHSMNYRSVMILGKPFEIADMDRKRRALDGIAEHLIPGRTAEARPPNERELNATTVVALSLGESSAKVRSGPPADDEDDLALPYWAGVLPIAPVTGTPIADVGLPPEIDLPKSVKTWMRNNRKAP